MLTRRHILGTLIGSIAGFSTGFAGTIPRRLDASYSFVLYYTHVGTGGALGSAVFESSTVQETYVIDADVKFPFSVQRVASILPLPCPSINKTYRYEDDGSQIAYTNEDGTFVLESGRRNLFQVAGEFIVSLGDRPLSEALPEVIHRDVFITCDKRSSRKDTLIERIDGKEFAQVIRDVRIACHGVHRVYGEDYLLVRAAPLNGLIPVLNTRFFKVGLVDVTGFVGADGRCPWITLRIDNYFDVSGVAETMFQQEERNGAFMRIYREVLDQE